MSPLKRQVTCAKCRLVTVLPASDSLRQDSLWVCPECGTACHQEASNLRILPGGGLMGGFFSPDDDSDDDSEE